MRNLFFIFTSIIFCIGLSIEVRADEKDIDWNRADHQLHIAGAYAINFTTYTILKDNTEMRRGTCLLISTASTILLGIAKESLSENYSQANIKATAVGATAAVIVPIIFEF